MNDERLTTLNAISLDRLWESFNRLKITLSALEKEQLERISLSSPYATEQLIKSPHIYTEWRKSCEQSLVFDVSQININGIDLTEKEIKVTLRQQRHYYLCHIIFNDVCLNLSVADILKQISCLAEKLINLALKSATSTLELLHGVPINTAAEQQPLMVLAMGKLGGGELNFSSDIDLIFVYSEDGQLQGQGKLSYREFYIRVGRLFTKLLNDKTEDGFVYRVDLRLRPWGDSGPLVINLAGLENYYQSQGRDWERYALVKAAVLSGNKQDKANLQQVITSFVYRKYHDFNVFSGLGSLKRQIDHEAKKKHQSLNIKLCSGGIREIEFCMQALQILQGGRHKHLQVTSILSMFELAKDEAFYNTLELDALKEAYLFFRLVENRIQMLNDQQTHLMPVDEEEQDRLMVSLKEENWQSLLLKVETAQLKVNAIFKQLFIEQIQQKNKIDFSIYDEADWSEFCEKLGFEVVDKIPKHLYLFFKERTILTMSSKGLDRLNELLPNFLTLISQKNDVLQLLNLLTELLLSIAKRSVYLEMLYMHQPLLQKLINLFSKSPWLANEVIRFPILLESVLIAEKDDVFNKKDLENLLSKELKQVEGDVELELDVLRVFKRQQLCFIALQELDEKIEPLTASAYLSELAEIMLQVSFNLNLPLLKAQYGSPCYEMDGQQYQANFAVIAYGKLGGQELHYSSDLDVIFLHDSCGQKQQTDGLKSIDNAQFFVRLAQKITQTMSLLTSSGRVYEIDARLRPNGASGFLVSSLDAYREYQKNKAWVWEHQALVRASYVAGDIAVKAKFQQIKCLVLAELANQKSLNQDVSAMREKMLQSQKPSNHFNLKQSKGGLIDIEFMVQYFVLLNANKLPSVCEYSANIALLKHLYDNNCLDEEYVPLIGIYQSLHKQLHLQFLQQSVDLKLNKQMKQRISVVNELWLKCFAIK